MDNDINIIYNDNNNDNTNNNNTNNNNNSNSTTGDTSNRLQKQPGRVDAVDG